MDIRALQIVDSYIDLKEGCSIKRKLYIVWKCKTLQNWKYLISSDLPDGIYYEVTYNGDKHEWYLDAYKKIHNEVITELK